jgi:hypothetical protein
VSADPPQIFKTTTHSATPAILIGGLVAGIVAVIVAGAPPHTLALIDLLRVDRLGAGDTT